MSTADQTIEAEIVAKGKTAPRVTPASIESVIASEHYFTAADGCLGEWQYRHDTSGGRTAPMEWVPVPLQSLTICVLVLRNGFTVVGKSACASPENFDAEIGRKVARADAIEQVWPLEGYLLKQMLHEAAISAA